MVGIQQASAESQYFCTSFTSYNPWLVPKRPTPHIVMPIHHDGSSRESTHKQSHGTTQLKSNISKKLFRPGGMARSEWTQSIKAVRDIPVAAYSAAGANTTRRITYCPPIAVSAFLLAQSVSYFKPTVWRCGRLWPYVGMESFGTHLHRDCNAMNDPAKTSPRIPSSCAQNAILSSLNIHIIPSHQIYVAIDNPSLIPSISWLTTSSYLWNYVRTADDVSHAENLQSYLSRCFAHLYKFRDGIQVTRVFWYCGEHQGEPVLNESSILIQELDFE